MPATPRAVAVAHGHGHLPVHGHRGQHDVVGAISRRDAGCACAPRRGVPPCDRVSPADASSRPPATACSQSSARPRMRSQRALPPARIAIAGRRRLGSRADGSRVPTAVAMKVRMGLHTGVAELRDGDYFGASLNRAARIMSAAHGDQVLLSAATAERCADSCWKASRCARWASIG